MIQDPAAKEPQLVIVLKNTTIGAELHHKLTVAQQFGEPLRVKLIVADHEVEAQLEVLNGPAPVFGGPHNTTTMSLCAVGPERKPVQEF